MPTITHLELQQRLLLITFKDRWDQDNIASLSELLFQRLSNDSLQHLNIVEHINGADRECIRFRYNNAYFILHFECYSNSCWVEPEDQIDTDMLRVIYQLLN